MESGDVEDGGVESESVESGGVESGGVEDLNPNPKCNPNPKSKKFSDPEFNSHLRQQTK